MKTDSPAGGGSPTILVVTPSGRLREALAPMGTEYDELAITAVPDAATAFECLDDGVDAELLVSEQELRDRSGIDLVGQVTDQYPEIPVLVAGPNLTAEAEQAALRAGAADAVRLTEDANSEAILRERAKRVLGRSVQGAVPDGFPTERHRHHSVFEALVSIYRETIAASDREALATHVCQKLLEVDAIEFLWLGMVDRHRNRIEPAVRAGSSADGLDEIGGPIPLSDDRPVVEAIRTDDVVIENTATASGHWADAAVKRGYESILSIPLERNGYPTAAITVFANESSVFTEPERQLFTDIADVLSFGMTALTWKQALVAQTVTDLEVTLTSGQDLFSRLAREVGATIEVTEIVPKSTTNRLFLTASGPTGEIEAALERETIVESITSLPHEEGRLFKLELELPELIEDIISEGGTLQSLQADGKMTRIAVTLPVEAEVRRVMGVFERNAAGVQLHSRTQRSRSFRTNPGFRVAFEQDVTDRQFEVLQAAYLSGYFEWPREHTAEEVATLLDISQPTFSRHLRRALENLLGLVFSADRD